MKPLFPFFGAKWRSARLYPEPTHGVVVEPFAGSAGYSTFHAPEKVLLLDVDPIIVAVWQYLIRVTPSEIRALPDLAPGQSVDSLALPQEARWLIGFWLNSGSAQPKKKISSWGGRWNARTRERIAVDIEGVRRWEIRQGNYETAPRITATWFVDPPYVDKGKYYRFRSVDYPALGAWIRDISGLVIVCEQAGASWLPFAHLGDVRSTLGTSDEVVFVRDSLGGRTAARAEAPDTLALDGVRPQKALRW